MFLTRGCEFCLVTERTRSGIEQGAKMSFLLKVAKLSSRDNISKLLLGVEVEMVQASVYKELESIAGEQEAWSTLLSLLPP